MVETYWTHEARHPKGVPFEGSSVKFLWFPCLKKCNVSLKRGNIRLSSAAKLGGSTPKTPRRTLEDGLPDTIEWFIPHRATTEA